MKLTLREFRERIRGVLREFDDADGLEIISIRNSKDTNPEDEEEDIDGTELDRTATPEEVFGPVPPGANDGDDLTHVSLDPYSSEWSPSYGNSGY